MYQNKFSHKIEKFVSTFYCSWGLLFSSIVTEWCKAFFIRAHEDSTKDKSLPIKWEIAKCVKSMKYLCTQILSWKFQKTSVSDAIACLRTDSALSRHRSQSISTSCKMNATCGRIYQMVQFQKKQNKYAWNRRQGAVDTIWQWMCCYYLPRSIAILADNEIRPMYNSSNNSNKIIHGILTMTKPLVWRA